MCAIQRVRIARFRSELIFRVLIFGRLSDTKGSYCAFPFRAHSDFCSGAFSAVKRHFCSERIRVLLRSGFRFEESVK